MSLVNCPFALSTRELIAACQFEIIRLVQEVFILSCRDGRLVKVIQLVCRGCGVLLNIRHVLAD